MTGSPHVQKQSKRMQNACTRVVATLAGLSLSLLAVTGHAGLIDFESGFGDQQAISTIVAPGLEIAVSCGTAAGQNDCYSFAYGGKTTAFGAGDNAAGDLGGFGLTDEFNGPKKKFNYYFEFDRSLTAFGLDLVDYRNDGGTRVGDVATLSVFSGTFGALLGSASFTVTSGLPDGNITSLLVASGAVEFASASLGFSRGDVGNSIDNLVFTAAQGGTAVNGAGSFTVGVLGIIALFALRRRNGMDTRRVE